MTKHLEDICPIKIEDEYKKNKQLQPDVIAELRKWASSKPNFPKNIPDVLFALFLHSANYNVDNAKSFIENSMRLRSNTPEFFKNRDPCSQSVQTIWELIYFWVAPDPTPENYRVIYTGFLDTDPTNYNFGDACKAFLLLGESYVITHGSTPGIVVVLDAKGGTYKHLFKAKVHLIMKFLSYIQDALPVNIRQVHIINVIPVIDKAMFLAKPFIKKELLDNIFFHSGSNLTEFYKKVPLEILPTDMGGKASTRRELQDKMIEDVKSLKEWFLADEKYLRLTNKNDENSEKIFKSEKKMEETEGSFQSLCID